MKLSQIIDSEQDQNGIESQFLWNLNRHWNESKFMRINLRELKVNFSFSKSRLSQIEITKWMALPNNQILGTYEEKDQDKSYLFIANENGNIKIIKSASLVTYNKYSFTSCYYDDSIFLFNWNRQAERYLISQNRWINLSKSPYGLDGNHSCFGFEQKIIICKVHSSECWVYDIILDSYSNNFSFHEIYGGWMIKGAGKIYSINTEYSTFIYCCYNPFSEWREVKTYSEIGFNFVYEPPTYFNGSLYYLRGRVLYEFSLKNFKSRVVKVI